MSCLESVQGVKEERDAQEKLAQRHHRLDRFKMELMMKKKKHVMIETNNFIYSNNLLNNLFNSI